MDTVSSFFALAYFRQRVKQFKKVILLLDLFFLEYEGRKKLTLKSPVIIKLNLYEVS